MANRLNYVPPFRGNTRTDMQNLDLNDSTDSEGDASSDEEQKIYEPFRRPFSKLFDYSDKNKTSEVAIELDKVPGEKLAEIQETEHFNGGYDQETEDVRVDDVNLHENSDKRNKDDLLTEKQQILYKVKTFRKTGQLKQPTTKVSRTVVRALEATTQEHQTVHVKITEEALKYALSKSDLGLIDIVLPEWKKYYSKVRTEDITPASWHPMIYAAKENNAQIFLHMKVIGQMDIPEPHDYFCSDKKCQMDSLKHALLRIHTYQALAKPAHLLSTDDPFEIAFDLRLQMLKLGALEKEFKTEYLKLADQVEVFTCDMLQLCRTKTELSMLLNRCRSPEKEGEYKSLARVIRTEAKGIKKFVTHDFVQRHLSEKFYGRSPRQRKFFLNHSNVTKGLLCLLGLPVWLLLGIGYVFFGEFATLYKPKKKPHGSEKPECAKYGTQKWPLYKIPFFYINALRFPVIKFYSHSILYLFFLLFLVLSTFRIIGKFDKITTERNTSMTWNQYLIYFYLIGYTWAGLKQLYSCGIKRYLLSAFNCLDTSMIVLYWISYVCRFIAFVKSSRALQYQIENPTGPYPNNVQYYLEPNRYHWDGFDPEIIADCLYAVATVVSFARLLYILPAFEKLGPLLVVLGKVMVDMMHFLSLLVIVFLAFLIGIHNLYMFYGPYLTPEGNVSNKAFGGIIETFHSLFWSMFGMGELDNTLVEAQGHYFVQVVGFLMYGTFHLIIVIMLINMLIAMLSASFEKTDESRDMEWKYARTGLWLNYICGGEILPVPFNIIPTAKSLIKYSKLLIYFFRNKCSKSKYNKKQKTYKKEYPALMQKLKKRYYRTCLKGENLEVLVAAPEKDQEINDEKFTISRTRTKTKQAFPQQHSAYDETDKPIVENEIQPIQSATHSSDPPPPESIRKENRGDALTSADIQCPEIFVSPTNQQNEHPDLSKSNSPNTRSETINETGPEDQIRQMLVTYFTFPNTI